MVIADTSVWIPFFNRPDSPEKATLDLLIDADEIALVGVVLAELLQGCRTQSERDSLSDALLALPYYEVTQSIWLQTGDLSAALLQQRRDPSTVGSDHRRFGNRTRLPRVQPGCPLQENSRTAPLFPAWS